MGHRLSRFSNRAVTLFDIQIVLRAGHTGLFPVREFKFNFFFVLFLFGYVLRSI